ncbi:DNA primase family protein [Cryobacterium zhongshanensis]|uniref:Phage/plasmid primase, P4 family n=1 Tax=Cryobacterium zhongshanensis TaxID=2928153 RepID=A0AA41QYL9_9MICO|nr:phage/plasmid primase, P4 family [Cryobacterium zhongshanensis]MCI4659564.1 phage/plasmid primase, P4 family [Cryobacterium zhongshanensis]
MGSTMDAGGNPGSSAGQTARSTPHTPTSAETLTERTVSKYLSTIVDDPSVQLGQIRDALLQRINAEIELENKGRKDAYSSSPPLLKLQVLDELTVVRVLLARRRIVAISLSGARAADDTVLAMFCEMGPDEGLYVISDAPIAQLASDVRPSFSGNAIESLLKRLRIHAPVVSKTIDAHLIPVANGVFDHDQQVLLDFSPDWVFLAKSPVDYDPLAPSPIIDTPHGDQWDVESWIRDLSDDEGVPELLWELLSAVVRPGVRWNKAAFLQSSRGNNGKGTLCELMRGLVGPDGHASVPIANFGKPFALTELVHARAIITDENSVGAFAKDLGDFKAIVTGDIFTLDRKYKDPISVSFSGMVVQCVNDFPKSRDKSASYTRRQLFIPFKKYFGDTERGYIKSDYLKRPDVLRYVLRRVLAMQHTQFSNPAACQELLAQFQRENNPVRDFWMEFEEEYVWGLLPTAFLYDLFVAWFRKTHPAGVPVNRNDFASNLVEVLSSDSQWVYTDPQKKHRPGHKMDDFEPLIAEYDLHDWMNPSYSGTDPAKRCIPALKTFYIGVTRMPLGSSASGAAGGSGVAGGGPEDQAREDSARDELVDA